MTPNWGMLHPLARHLPEEMPPSYGRMPEVEMPRGPFVMDGGGQKRDARVEMESQRPLQSSSWDKGGMGELASTAGILPTAQYLGHKAETPTSAKALDFALDTRGHSSHMEANNLNIVAEINRLKDQEEELRRGGGLSKYSNNSKDEVLPNPETRDPNNSVGGHKNTPSEAGLMPPSMGSNSGASINDEATHNAILRKMKQETADGEDWISCSLCPFSANDDAVFKRHIAIMHEGGGRMIKNKTYKCDRCDFITDRPRMLKNHKIFMHESSGLFPCDSCDYKALSPHVLKVHKTSKHDREQHYCDLCDFSTNWPANLTTHRKKKHMEPMGDIDAKRFPCDRCEYQALSINVLEVHKSSKHDRVRYNCDMCDFSTNWPANLTTHKKKKHMPPEEGADTKMYPCDRCDYQASNIHVLEVHQTSKHDRVQYTCDMCEFTTNWPANLSTHRKKKHMDPSGQENVKKFPCDRCDYAAHSHAVLEVHKSSKHDRVQYRCDMCDYTSNWPTNLATHRKKKHMKSREKREDLDEEDWRLDPKFVTTLPPDLKITKMEKTQEKRYNCDLCEFSTNWFDNLETHRLKRHGNVKRELPDEADENEWKLDPEFLAALPPNLREEALEQWDEARRDREEARYEARRDRIEAMAASRGEVNASIERFKRRRTMSESGSSIATITKVTAPDSIKPEADTDT